MTNKYKFLKNLFTFLSVWCNTGPLVYFILRALFSGEVTATKKVTLTFTVMACLVLVALNAIKKYNLKSPTFILIIGLYIALDNLLALFIILGVTTMLDEFVFTPLKKKYKAKYIINKEIDKRE